jgi:hypothetical protein
MLLALAELMVQCYFRDRVTQPQPPNGDDAGAFTYTLQRFAWYHTGWNFSNAGPFTTGLAAGTYTTTTLSQSPDCAVT